MPASVLTFTATVREDSRPALDAALNGLRARFDAPGRHPFSALATLHFASAVVFDTRGFAPTLVFEHNFDGPLDAYLDALVAAGAADVYALYSCCRDLPRLGGA